MSGGHPCPPNLSTPFIHRTSRNVSECERNFCLQVWAGGCTPGIATARFARWTGEWPVHIGIFAPQASLIELSHPEELFSGGIMIGFLSILAVGFFLGMRHAT